MSLIVCSGETCTRSIAACSIARTPGFAKQVQEQRFREAYENYTEAELARTVAERVPLYDRANHDTHLKISESDQIPRLLTAP